MSPTTKRFITTSQASQSCIKRSLQGAILPPARPVNRNSNTKTNFILGTDTVLYETDAMARQRDVQQSLAAQGGGGEGQDAYMAALASQKAEHQALKRALMATHFTLTDHHTPDAEDTANRKPRRMRRGGRYAASFYSNEEDEEGMWTSGSEEEGVDEGGNEERGRRAPESEWSDSPSSLAPSFPPSRSCSIFPTSCPLPPTAPVAGKHRHRPLVFGQDRLDYHSSATDMFRYQEEEAEEGGKRRKKPEQTRLARQAEVAAMKEALRTTNISFNDGGPGEGPRYRTHYQDTFLPSLPLAASWTKEAR